MRTATYTTAMADEVCLRYTIEANPGNVLNGTPGIAFYDIERYRHKQKEHGVSTYPEPVNAP